MISIIIASVDSGSLERLQANIEQSIGVSYELLVYENGNAEKGLCELYNLGARQAKYEILCYMHEDLALKTNDWGKIVVGYFERPQVGVLGLAGSAFKSSAPSGWGTDDKEKSLNFRNFIQHFKREERDPILENYNPSNLKEMEVVTLDGMWFCTTKTVVSEHSFDEDTLKGFHGYDLDFCINVSQKYKLLVTYEVLIAHFSEGGYDKQWVSDTLQIHRKWKGYLPIGSVKISSKREVMIAFRSLRAFLRRMINLRYERAEINNVFEEYKHLLSWYLRLKLRLFLFKELSKTKKG